MSTKNSDPWRKASAAALARLNPKPSGDDAAAERLVQLINERRAHGDAPAVTASFSSAETRARWRIAAQDLDAALADAAGAYAVAAGVDGDALAADVSAALALPPEQTVGWSDTSEAYADTDDSEPYDGDAADDDSDASHEGDDDTDGDE